MALNILTTRQIELNDLYIVNCKAKDGYMIISVKYNGADVVFDEDACLKSKGVLNQDGYEEVNICERNGNQIMTQFVVFSGKKQYLVSLKQSDDTPIDETTVDYDDSYTVPDYTETVPLGMYFECWVDDKNFQYFPDDIIEGIRADITLYPLFEPIKHTITFVAEDTDRVFYDNNQVVEFTFNYGTDKTDLLSIEPQPTFIDNNDCRSIIAYDDFNHLIVWKAFEQEKVYFNGSIYGTLEDVLPNTLVEDITITIMYHRRVNLSTSLPIEKFAYKDTHWYNNNINVYVSYGSNINDSDVISFVGVAEQYDKFDYWEIDNNPSKRYYYASLEEAFENISNYDIENDMSFVAHGIQYKTFNASFLEDYGSGNTITFSNQYEFPDNIIKLVPGSVYTIGDLLSNYTINIENGYTISKYQVTIGSEEPFLTSDIDYTITVDDNILIEIELEAL